MSEQAGERGKRLNCCVASGRNAESTAHQKQPCPVLDALDTTVPV